MVQSGVSARSAFKSYWAAMGFLTGFAVVGSPLTQRVKVGLQFKFDDLQARGNPTRASTSSKRRLHRTVCVFLCRQATCERFKFYCTEWCKLAKLEHFIIQGCPIPRMFKFSGFGNRRFLTLHAFICRACFVKWGGL